MNKKAMEMKMSTTLVGLIFVLLLTFALFFIVRGMIKKFAG